MCSVCVVLAVRGQHIAQTPTPASILHAPGRSECWHQLRLWPLIQSPQLLQLLRYLHEPLSIQQPHEPCRQRALPTGQSEVVLPQFICKYIMSPHIGSVHIVQSTSSPPPPLLLFSLFRICNCIWLKLKFRNSMFSKITASVGFYVRLPKPWIYFSYSKLLHL